MMYTRTPFTANEKERRLLGLMPPGGLEGPGSQPAPTQEQIERETTERARREAAEQDPFNNPNQAPERSRSVRRRTSERLSDSHRKQLDMLTRQKAMLDRQIRELDRDLKNTGRSQRLNYRRGSAILPRYGGGRRGPATYEYALRMQNDAQMMARMQQDLQSLRMQRYEVEKQIDAIRAMGAAGLSQNPSSSPASGDNAPNTFEATPGPDTRFNLEGALAELPPEEAGIVRDAPPRAQRAIVDFLKTVDPSNRTEALSMLARMNTQPTALATLFDHFRQTGSIENDGTLDAQTAQLLDELSGGEKRQLLKLFSSVSSLNSAEGGNRPVDVDRAMAEKYLERWQKAKTEADRMIAEGMLLMYGVDVDQSDLQRGQLVTLTEETQFFGVIAGIFKVVMGMIEKFGGKSKKIEAPLPDENIDPASLSPEQLEAVKTQLGEVVTEGKKKEASLEEKIDKLEKQKNGDPKPEGEELARIDRELTQAKADLKAVQAIIAKAEAALGEIAVFEKKKTSVADDTDGQTPPPAVQPSSSSTQSTPRQEEEKPASQSDDGSGSGGGGFFSIPSEPAPRTLPPSNGNTPATTPDTPPQAPANDGTPPDAKPSSEGKETPDDTSAKETTEPAASKATKPSDEKPSSQEETSDGSPADDTNAPASKATESSETPSSAEQGQEATEITEEQIEEVVKQLDLLDEARAVAEQAEDGSLAALKASIDASVAEMEFIQANSGLIDIGLVTFSDAEAIRRTGVEKVERYNFLVSQVGQTEGDDRQAILGRIRALAERQATALNNVIVANQRSIMGSNEDREASGLFGSFHRGITGSDPYQIDIDDATRRISSALAQQDAIFKPLQEELSRSEEQIDLAKVVRLANSGSKALRTLRKADTDTERYDVEQEAISASRDVAVAIITLPVAFTGAPATASLGGVLRFGAIKGAEMAFLQSGTRNTDEVMQGKKTVKEAMISTAEDTAEGAVIGAATAGVFKGLGSGFSRLKLKLRPTAQPKATASSAASGAGPVEAGAAPTASGAPASGTATPSAQPRAVAPEPVPAATPTPKSSATPATSETATATPKSSPAPATEPAPTGPKTSQGNKDFFTESIKPSDPEGREMLRKIAERNAAPTTPKPPQPRPKNTPPASEAPGTAPKPAKPNTPKPSTESGSARPNKPASKPVDPREAELRAAESLKTKARAAEGNLQSAEARLRSTRSQAADALRGYDKAIEIAEDKVLLAERNLASAKTPLEKTSAQLALENAADDLARAERAAELASAQHSTWIASAELEVRAAQKVADDAGDAFMRLEQQRMSRPTNQPAPKPNDPSLTTGIREPQPTSGPLTPQQRIARARTAEAHLESAQARLNSARSNASKTATDLGRSVSRAENAVKSAKLKVDNATTTLEKEAATLELQNAANELARAERTAKIAMEQQELWVEAARREVTAAEQQASKAARDISELRPAQLQAGQDLQFQIDMAKVGLRKAQEFARGAIRQAERAVESAERSLASSRANIDNGGLLGRSRAMELIRRAEQDFLAAKAAYQRVVAEQGQSVLRAETTLRGLEKMQR